MSEQILEGTWEEVSTHADELAGKWVRVIVLEKAPKPEPNYAMLEALRCIEERDKDRPLTSGEDTQRMIREARNGGMYGYNSAD